MRWRYYRAGSPLLQLDDLGLDVWLLPCAKWQFELFLGEGIEGFGNSWYEHVLAVNPRASWRGFDGSHPERLFLTGILPPEARAFARWLGAAFDIQVHHLSGFAELRPLGRTGAIRVSHLNETSPVGVHSPPDGAIFGLPVRFLSVEGFVDILEF